jgi:hypothetical protein
MCGTSAARAKVELRIKAEPWNETREAALPLPLTLPERISGCLRWLMTKPPGLSNVDPHRPRVMRSCP